MSSDSGLTTDVQQLNLLKLFHYIWGAFCCVWGLIGVAYVWIGESVLKHVERIPAKENIPLIFGQLFVTFSVIGLVLLESSGVLSLIAAGKFGSRKGYRTCFVVSIVNCILMPVGTALGVFTLAVLNRTSIKALFNDADRLKNAK
ncbi:MAG: hypothetical protein JO025_22035 [Verrucomicrobia bacterium]|nr:hypothetical protein [Verrucomicrobiota bacterium]